MTREVRLLDLYPTILNLTQHQRQHYPQACFLTHAGEDPFFLAAVAAARLASVFCLASARMAGMSSSSNPLLQALENTSSLSIIFTASFFTSAGSFCSGFLRSSMRLPKVLAKLSYRGLSLSATDSNMSVRAFTQALGGVIGEGAVTGAGVTGGGGQAAGPGAVAEKAVAVRTQRSVFLTMRMREIVNMEMGLQKMNQGEQCINKKRTLVCCVGLYTRGMELEFTDISWFGRERQESEQTGIYQLPHQNNILLS